MTHKTHVCAHHHTWSYCVYGAAYVWTGGWCRTLSGLHVWPSLALDKGSSLLVSAPDLPDFLESKPSLLGPLPRLGDIIPVHWSLVLFACIAVAPHTCRRNRGLSTVVLNADLNCFVEVLIYGTLCRKWCQNLPYYLHDESFVIWLGLIVVMSLSRRHTQRTAS